MKTSRMFISGALVSAAFFLTACTGGKTTSDQQYEENPIVHQTTPADLELTKSKAPITADAATLYVNGMGCPLCATNIDLQLERIRGVDTVYVDLGIGKVDLTFKGNDRPSPARLATAVEDAGFTLVKIETH